MTAAGETNVTVESMSLMRRGMFEEGWDVAAPWGDLYEEDGAREREEDEFDHELDSGKMSMYTGVRESGSWLCLDDGIIGLYCAEDVGESADEEADESSLGNEAQDIEESEGLDDGPPKTW